jgi:hypothetical protein
VCSMFHPPWVKPEAFKLHHRSAKSVKRCDWRNERLEAQSRLNFVCYHTLISIIRFSEKRSKYISSQCKVYMCIS